MKFGAESGPEGPDFRRSARGGVGSCREEGGAFLTRRAGRSIPMVSLPLRLPSAPRFQLEGALAILSGAPRASVGLSGAPSSAKILSLVAR